MAPPLWSARSTRTTLEPHPIARPGRPIVQVVVDPGTEGYHAFMLEQLARHIVYEDAFVGYIIDRSDWMDVTSLARDDGLTFIPEAVAETGSGVGASLKVSYQRVVADLRAVLDAGPAAQAALRASLPPAQRGHLGTMNGTGLMMMNVVGNARLDQFAPYDGIFSEGSLISGAGLLGIASPTILWTYDSNECCRSDAWADFYFQRHLLMAVMPMQCFPANDHAIGFDAASAAHYVRYGPMMAATAPSVWALLPHVVAVVNVTGTSTYAKVNAFIAPLGPDAADVALLVPVMLGAQPNGTVEVNLTRISRVWAGPASESAHPLVRARARAGRRRCSHARRRRRRRKCLVRRRGALPRPGQRLVAGQWALRHGQHGGARGAAERGGAPARAACERRAAPAPGRCTSFAFEEWPSVSCRG